MVYIKQVVALASLMLLTSTASAQLVVITNSFDENGNWSWTSNGISIGEGTIYTQISGGGIQYSDPWPGPSMIGMTFGFYEPEDTNVLSDLIHFDTATNFSYYSDIGDSELADLTSISLEQLVINNAAYGWGESIATNRYIEIGSEGNNHIEFPLNLYQGEDLVGTEVFVGISDVPEPATLGLLALGGLALLWRRRS